MASAEEPIYQPGVFDGGTAADTVAHLKRWRLNQDMDAALAQLDGSRGVTRDLLELGPRVPFPVPDPGPFAGGGVMTPVAGGQAAGGGTTVDLSADVDSLVAEILAEIRRSRPA